MKTHYEIEAIVAWKSRYNEWKKWGVVTIRTGDVEEIYETFNKRKAEKFKKILEAETPTHTFRIVKVTREVVG